MERTRRQGSRHWINEREEKLCERERKGAWIEGEKERERYATNTRTCTDGIERNDEVRRSGH